MIELILQGFFTGLGVVAGTWVFNRYLTPRLERHEESIKKGVDDVKKVFQN